jgi:sterol desaturase/sphingolipid hydroxylase (fatty acid hydroxylase superfamily)
MRNPSKHRHGNAATFEDPRHMSYDWQATLTHLLALVAMTLSGRALAFRVPALRRMRDLNRDADAGKLADDSFRAAVKVNNRFALLTNATFYAAVLPWCLTLEARPLWRHVWDIAVVLMVYDFFYYLTHRFLFHGAALRRVHALHHRARKPTHIDALYVHPIETTIGLILFFATIPLVAALAGAPLNAYSMAVATLIFTQLNTINHTYINLPYFPFRALSKITWLHAAHHVDMKRGNYATLTMLYDWLFGTLEAPVHRPAP